jgi:hypothetical protein
MQHPLARLAARSRKQVLGNLAAIVPGEELGTVSHYDIQPVLDVSTPT